MKYLVRPAELLNVWYFRRYITHVTLLYSEQSLDDFLKWLIGYAAPKGKKKASYLFLHCGILHFFALKYVTSS